MVKRKRKQKSSVLAIVLILALLLTAVFLRFKPTWIFPSPTNWVSPGWEVWNQVAAMGFTNGTILKDPSDFSDPRELMGVYWKVDADDKDWGLPAQECVLGDISHVDFSGMSIPWDQPARELPPIVRGNKTYYLDYHIYIFTVAVRTLADRTQYGRVPVPPNPLVTVPVWKHDTSWEHECWTGVLGGDLGYNTYVGEMFKGGWYTKFVIDPWKGVPYRIPPEPPEGSYYEVDAWAGVMNSYVHAITADQVKNQWGEMPTPLGDAQIWYKGGLPQGAQIPMFQDDGTFGTPAPTIDWNPDLQPDEDIFSTIVLYLPMELQAGADTHNGAYGEADALYPCDVQVFYTVRMDVLMTHEFFLQGGEPPPIYPWEDFFNWCYDFWDGLFRSIGLNNPFNIFGEWGGFVAMIFFLLVAFVVIGVILLIFTRGKLNVFKNPFKSRKGARDTTDSIHLF